MERVTLWLEEEARLYCGVAEVVLKEPGLLLKMPYSDTKDKAIRYAGRYLFRVSPEISDEATEFWPYWFQLLSSRLEPAFDPRWLYLRFAYEVG